MNDVILTLYTYAMDDYRRRMPLLAEARQAYFSAPDAAAVPRTASASDGSIARYIFRKDGLHWRLRQGKQEIQRSLRGKNGFYDVRTRQPDGTVRLDRFSPNHRLISVQYFAGKTLCGEVIPMPDGSLDTAFLIPEDNAWLRETLVPCPEMPWGSSDTARWTRVLGIPPALVQTPGGITCFYPVELADKAQTLPERFAGEDAAPVTPEESEDEVLAAAAAEDLRRAETQHSKLSPPPAAAAQAATNAKANDWNHARFDDAGALLAAGSSSFGTVRMPDDTTYIGQWAHHKPHGTGLLVNSDGTLRYQGQWQNGLRHGTGTEYRQGAVCYTGAWAEDRHHGPGVLHRPDGSTVSGSFLHGVPSGELTLRDPSGAVLYRGAMAEDLPHGQGVLYRNGQPRYQGTFRQGVLTGPITLYENGHPVYTGDLQDGIRQGIGTSLKDGHPHYFGQWDHDHPTGFGLLYRDGQPWLVGTFVDGVPDGRINAYLGGTLYREMLFRRGEEEFRIEYQDNVPVFAGSIRQERRNGPGRMLDTFGQCTAQGIFQDDQLVRPGQVIPRSLMPLTCPEALRDTLCDTLTAADTVYVFSMPWAEGIYAGSTRDGLPHGPGSLVCADHTFAGQFVCGHPQGEGLLRLRSGEEIRALFHPDGAQRIVYPFLHRLS